MLERISISVQTADFDLAAEYARLAADASIGAIVQFVGRVRERCDGHMVRSLHLEHYPGMSEKVLHEIAGRAMARWDLLGIRIVHRVGRLEPADQIVLVQVAATHRAAAFEAAEALMDLLKTEAPFWKQEATPDGARWLDARETDERAAQRWRKGTT